LRHFATAAFAWRAERIFLRAERS